MPKALSGIAATLSIAGLVGCAGSPPAPISSTKERRAEAVARATAYCRKKGLTMRAGAADGPTRPGQVAADFDFRCVKAR